MEGVSSTVRAPRPGLGMPPTCITALAATPFPAANPSSPGRRPARMIAVHCARVSILVPTNADLAVSITTSHEKSDATRQRRYGRALGAMPLDHVGCGGAHACRQGRHIERRQGLTPPPPQDRKSTRLNPSP